QRRPKGRRARRHGLVSEGVREGLLRRLRDEGQGDRLRAEGPVVSRVTAQDRAYARHLLDAVRSEDEEALAKLLAAIHERVVSCAVVRAEQEREAADVEKAPRFSPDDEVRIEPARSSSPNGDIGSVVGYGPGFMVDPRGILSRTVDVMLSTEMV